MVTFNFKKKNNSSHSTKHKNYADRFETAIKNLDLYVEEEKVRNKMELNKKFEGYIL
ncbi:MULTISPECIES: hypothetical protein [unclassified Flammeovirga]|uniref:hypothetical protein n=1 Tax=unclassified Flammeovirga TaxID=2637820 RepID=UPI0012E001C3|nr:MULTISPECIES: hypothetical protein [unclassified Flammeovirga]MBD0400170.1 hypothetical protein [Flammeovirga sp. EKP202]